MRMKLEQERIVSSASLPPALICFVPPTHSTGSHGKYRARPRTGSARPGPVRRAPARQGPPTWSARQGPRTRGPHRRITLTPGKQWLGPPLALARTRCPRPGRPGTLASTTHSHASTARTGFAGAIRLHLRVPPTHLRCTALKAPNRPGPARARTADSDNARAELG
jgi:hypothetical protein